MREVQVAPDAALDASADASAEIATIADADADATDATADSNLLDSSSSASIVDLMLGGQARSLPERATDPDSSFDFHARDTLAPRSGNQIRKTTITVDHGLAPEVVTRIVRQNFGRFRLCYEAALQANPALGGSVVFGFTIDAAGTPSLPVEKEGTVDSVPLVSCLARAMTKVAFPAPDGAPPANVTYGLAFTPGF